MGVKRWLGLMLVLLALASGKSARAESAGEGLEARADEVSAAVDLGGFQRAAADAGVELDVGGLLETLLSGDAGSVIRDLPGYLQREAEAIVCSVLPALIPAAVPALLWAVLAHLTSGSGAKLARCACALCCAAALMKHFFGVYEMARAAVGRAAGLNDALTPVLVTLLTLTGGTKSAALITPMGALASRLMALAVQKAALPLTAAGLGLSVSGAVGRLKLGRLASAARSFAKWILTTAVTAYLAMMSTGGLLSGAYDGAAIRGAKLAVDRLIPIIGGKVAGTMESLAASASVVRGAVGVVGFAALALLCARPVVAALTAMVGLKLLAAALEPIGDEVMAKLMDAFAAAYALLAAAVTATLALTLILIGATVGLGVRLGG